MTFLILLGIIFLLIKVFRSGIKKGLAREKTATSKAVFLLIFSILLFIGSISFMFDPNNFDQFGFIFALYFFPFIGTLCFSIYEIGNSSASLYKLYKHKNTVTKKDI